MTERAHGGRDPGRAGSFPPAPPQTRASGFPAHGSSSHRFHRPVIRPRSVYTIQDHCVSRVCPSVGPVTVSAPSLLPGSKRHSSPAFIQYYEQTKTPVGLLRALPLSVEHQYLSDSLCSLHLARELVGSVAWSLITGGDHSGLCLRTSTGLSCSQGTLLCLCHVL